MLAGTQGFEIHNDIIYLPKNHTNPTRNYGLYHQDGRIVNAAGNFVGPQTHLVDQASNINFELDECEKYFDEMAFYIGPITNHYGHFLVTSLSRIWASRFIKNKKIKYIYHGTESPQQIFQTNFIRDFFSALDICPHDLVHFDVPTRVGRVITPYPAFQELSYAFEVFADFFRDMANRWTEEFFVSNDSRPVFLSKNLIQSGVSGFLNESEFVESLGDQGVEIIYPETLSLIDQIALFRSGRIIGGMYGSAFHTSLFSHRNKFIILNYEEKVWTNQVIIDKICRNQTLYVYDDKSIILQKTERYMNNFMLNDPKSLAKEFSEKMYKLDNKEVTAQKSIFASKIHPEYEVMPEVLEVQSMKPIVKKYKFSIVACARWESAYIVEWINYYRAIGFDHIFLYCNDDDPSLLYEKVLPFLEGAEPFVTFRFYPDQGQQLRMYSHFLKFDRDSTEWISFFDIDEFLRLPSGLKINNFVENFDRDVDCILFNWIFFGPDGHKDVPGASILSEYRRRQGALHPFTKYIARSRIFTGPKLTDVEKGHGFWHCPIDQIDQAIKVVNVLNEDMSDYYKGFPTKPMEYVNDPIRKDRILETAVIHHYAFRTEKAFQDRVDRGLGGAFDGQVMWGKIASGDKFSDFVAGLNEIEDLSLTKFWPVYLAQSWNRNVLIQKQNDILETENNSGQVSDVQLFSKFVSLGINCELGIVQKKVGVTKFGLLDWFATHPSDLLKLLQNQFSGIGSEEQTRITVLGDEYIIEDTRYNLRGHSFVKPSEVDQEKFFKETCSRLSYLKRKMIEDLEDGVSIFVYKLRDSPLGEDMLQSIASQISTYGPGNFLSISDARFTGKPDGHVERLGSNIISAHLAKLAPYDCANDVDMLGWRTVCRKTVALISPNISVEPVDATMQGLRQRVPISRRKRAMQSSVSQWSIGDSAEFDAAGAINGVIDGRGKFHTDIEDSPWWQVDLGEIVGISEVRLYNRMEQPAVAERSSKLAIEIGLEAETLVEVFRRMSDEAFGGVDGNPLIFKPAIPVPGRYVRIRLLTRNYLHLDQVEVYGENLRI